MGGSRLQTVFYYFFQPTDCCSAAAADPDKSNKVGENWQMQVERLLPARRVLSPDAAQRVFSLFLIFLFFCFFRAASVSFFCFVPKCISQ